MAKKVVYLNSKSLFNLPIIYSELPYIGDVSISFPPNLLKESINFANSLYLFDFSSILKPTYVPRPIAGIFFDLLEFDVELILHFQHIVDLNVVLEMY